MFNHAVRLLVLFIILYSSNVFASVKIVAMVNDELISNLDLEKRIAINKFFYKVEGNTAEEIALNALIDESIWRQEARKLKVTVTERDLLEAIKQFLVIKNLGNIDLKSYVEAQGLDYKLFVQHMKSKLLWNKILMLKIAPYIIISDKEVQDSRDNMVGNGLDISVHIQEVMLPASMNDNESIISSIISELQSGVSVETIKANRKDVLFEEASVNVKNIDANLANKLLNAKIGDVIGPMKSEYGTLIIKLIHRSDINKEFANSNVDLRQMHLNIEQGKEYLDQISILKTKATCENFNSVAKELGLPEPLSFVIKVKDLSVKIQNVLQSCDVGKVVEVTDNNVVDVIMLCNVTKGKADDVVDNADFIKQRLYMEKLSMQSEYLLSTLKKNALIEKYN
ncbi:surA domain protein [Ehrlichia chaffeensis str. Arkansas]|uniref:SurA domain protein n=1 Tax=Ehrlichia chaffeensis (strain ATCC CRL-10679 / Arkansas) TaxID=205920 RepID=Q2GHQ0_EHRCR|nr:SurA N-terminal domain-containing protein [Ehrlichia chaffeensis]ABD45164.1 surA domain protein [Ehrlichia chaffeensis str. Arkansas]AHX05936.1 surA N-terminal domain protein [Ehrlichia chaffeensis str. Jax]